MATTNIKRTLNASEMVPVLRDYEALLDRVSQRAYEIFDSRGRSHGHDLEDWFAVEQQIPGTASADVETMQGGVRIRVFLPGFKPGCIDIAAGPQELVVRAERFSKQGRPEVTVMRKVRFPFTAEPRCLTATYRNGVLTVEVPQGS